MGADDDDDDTVEEDDRESGPTEEEIRAALRELRGDEPALRHVILLAAASDGYAVPLVPKPAIDAIVAKYSMDRDLANGGMDQVVWNGGVEHCREVAGSLRTVGAIENADLIDRLCGALEQQLASAGEAGFSGDPVKHFIAFRKAVGGPFFGVPDLGAEVAEAVLEFVIERVDSLPDPDGELPPRSQ